MILRPHLEEAHLQNDLEALLIQFVQLAEKMIQSSTRYRHFKRLATKVFHSSVSSREVNAGHLGRYRASWKKYGREAIL